MIHTPCSGDFVAISVGRSDLSRSELSIAAISVKSDKVAPPLLGVKSVTSFWRRVDGGGGVEIEGFF